LVIREDTARPALVAQAAVVVIAALGVAAVSLSYLNDDTAWYLHMARVWLDGGRLYRDVIDTNPPLIVFLTALPVALAGWLHVPEPVTFKVCVLAAIVGSMGLSWAGLSRAWTNGWHRIVVVATLVFALVVFIGPDFGQREHVAVLLVAPYVFAACAWAAGRPLPAGLEWGTAVSAGIGFALKPYFMAGWLAVEIARVVLDRSTRSLRRPGVTGVVAIQILYVAVVVLLVPDYLQVARDAWQVYDALNASPSVMWGLVDWRFWGLACIAAAVPIPRDARRSGLVLLAAATGFLVGAMVQSKGWPYQLYPSRVFLWLFAATWLTAFVSARPVLDRAIGGARTVATVLLVALIVFSGRAFVDARGWRGSVVDTFIERVRSQPRHESLAMLSMRNIMWPAFPAVNYTGTQWVLRHHSLWFLPGMYAREFDRADGAVAPHAPDAMSALERRYFGDIVDDLCRTPPRLLVIQPPVPSLPAGGRAIDLVAYYRQDPRFARLFSGYDETGSLDTFVFFTRQRDVPCGAGAGESPVR